MKCASSQCRTEASVFLTQELNKPNWFCPYCASRMLDIVHPTSYNTLKEMSYAEERIELDKLKKVKKTTDKVVEK